MKTAGFDIDSAFALRGTPGALAEQLYAARKPYGETVFAWRLPGSTTVNFMTGAAITDHNSFDVLNERGFVFCPFDTSRHPVKFSACKALLAWHADTHMLTPLLHSQATALPADQEDFFLKEAHIASGLLPQAPDMQEDTTQSHFVSMAQKAIDLMQKGDFQKVVTARKQSIEHRMGIGEAFDSALALYPTAFVYVFMSADLPFWMGVTPEVLAAQDEQGIFSTTALAGTQVTPASGDISDTAWTHKEIEEQAMVSRYIINCFKQIRLREYEETGPATVKFGNLRHLKTDYKVDTQALNFPDLGKVMAELLHPTSAVCGMPKAEALDFLRQHEDFDRGYFAGFLGPCHLSGRTDLYVNIRSAQVFDKHAVLYAGAGLTARSVAHKEWHETEAKLKTMKKIFE